MIPAKCFAGKQVALFGLGGSGVATAEALMAGGANVAAWDDNPETRERASDSGIDLVDLRSADWSGFACLVLSPGVPLTHPQPHWCVELARQAKVEIVGDIELFARERRAVAPGSPFIAITGTNGKSTTTALIAHVIAASGRDAQMGGNIGRAVLTLKPPATDRYHVVECSSYQIDLSPTLDPSVGILLNLTPDHIDRHGTFARYAAVKERLVAGSRTAIVAVDDEHCAAIADRAEIHGQKVIRISTGRVLPDGYFLQETALMRAENGHLRQVADLAGMATLRGRHNAQNALAAVAALEAAGLESWEIDAGLRSFPGLAHRMELVGRRDKVLFVNDSKATNAEAAAPALSTYDRIYWIVGGLAKEGGIDSLQPLFGRIAKAYLIGEAAPAFAAVLGATIPYEISGTIRSAVENAAADSARDDSPEAVVLLSPACASFDQFRNFEVRGDAFRQAVMELDDVEAIGETD
ncbi:UDP-N-acetylmuramoyl-L-alanine--D-glutamate ligase [Chelativorans sp. ZYF759]|uniref:UDP-N-acetylmuramoyl-L-alanine--D-glutamate ligase n=1 Tax=Chelativorans sp. ZYF759 TaxID=2692213 RepID=UPI00145E195F|nr:UDP-N-acetylmuramoyl-L-alanine--D-glutamate ligase [Chelativorans sp. ZYF759]NMG41494.1 UDP-N-acetylmuramoyl-L-alanine--D-glutamate ligase [Chelativorans sp. ZYF759]